MLRRTVRPTTGLLPACLALLMTADAALGQADTAPVNDQPND